MRKLRILMLSDFKSLGGAAIAASRLGMALAADGHDVVRVVKKGEGDSHCVIIDEMRDLPERLRLGWISLPWRVQQQLSAGLVRKKFCKIAASLKPDVISIHNLHGGGPGWDWNLVEMASDVAPVVWTLHDMWSFTGRCAYTFDCQKFIDGCDSSCPTAEEYPSLPQGKIRSAWEGRARLFRRANNLAAVSPSSWLAGQAREGFWKDHQVAVIANSAPLNMYTPMDRALARKALAIPDRGPVVLVATQAPMERRKGGAILFEALRILAGTSFHLVTMGATDGCWPEDADGRITHLGHIDFERAKVLAYNAADIFLHPAPVDNLPNTIVESLACGTPVVALPIGGVTEMVIPVKTGWLAAEVSPAGLATALRAALDCLRDGADLREQCRSFARANYDPALQSARYESLFRSLLDLKC